MEIVWFIGEIDKEFVIQALNCKSEAELCSVLDTIYDRIAQDMKAQPKEKPTIKFVPMIRRIETYNAEKGQVEVYEDNGNCRRDDILIATNPRMKVAIIHEFVHWLRRDMKEKEARRATEELVKLWSTDEVYRR